MKTKIFTRFLAIAFLLLGSFAAKAQCNSAWSYVVPVTVSNSSSGGFTGFQVEVDLSNTANLVSIGHMQPNGTDIRFADGNCTNLPYWIDPATFGTSKCVIWVKTNTIVANGTQTINMYYGNSSMTSPVSSGDNTFDLFDDFTVSSINGAGHAIADPNKWTTNNSSSTPYTFTSGSNVPSFSTGYPADLNIKGTIGASSTDMVSVKSFTGAVILESNLTNNSNDKGTGGDIGMAIVNGAAGYALYDSSNSYINFNGASSGSGSFSSYGFSGNGQLNSTPTTSGFPAGTYGIAWPQSGQEYAYWPGGAYTGNDNHQTITSAVKVEFGVLSSGSGFSDFDATWIRVRQYSASAPTSTPGIEFTNSIATTTTGSAVCVGATISVPIFATGSYNSDNVFSVDLSDANGNFSGSYSPGIAAVNATGSNTISVTLPAGVTGGNFKLRIEASDAVGFTGTVIGAPTALSFQILAYPIANVGNNQVICAGQSATIGAASVFGDTYSWTSSPVGYTSTMSNPTVSPTAATNVYTLTEANLAGCSTTHSVTISVNPIPAAVAGPNATVVVGTSVQLGTTAVGTDIYAWAPSTYLSSTTISNPTSIPTAAGMSIYTVTETNPATSCSNSHSDTITAIAITSSISTPPATVCSGSNVTLVTAATNAPNATYQWSKGAVTQVNISGATSPTLNITGITATNTYYVTIINNNQSATATTSAGVKITVNALPAAAVGSPSTICSGSSTTVGATAVGSDVYSWSPSTGLSNSTVSKPTASPTSTTTYTVTETNPTTGCSKSNSVTVTVNASPAASINVPSPLCGSGTLTASGGGTYLWNNGTTNATLPVSASGTYAVTVTAGGCKATASSNVTVNTPPTASISVPSLICGSGTLTASGGAQYLWNDGSTNSTLVVSTSGTYAVTVTAGTGCTASTSKSVTVNTPPTASISVPSPICGSGTLTANGGGSYLWSNGTTNSTLGVTASGTYALTVTDGNGCTASASQNVTVNTPPSPSISSATICAGNSTILDAGSYSSYVWSDNSKNETLTVSPTSNTTYSVTVTDGNGCMGTSSATVTVNPVPAPSASANPATIVLGNSSTLSTAATSGDSYVWSDGTSNTYANSASISVSPTSTTTYTVTETSASHCTGTPSTVTVNVVSPNIQVQGNSTNIANGSTTPANANVTEFGPTTTGTESETYTIINKGTSQLTVSSIGISGANASNFTFDNTSISLPATIAANGGTATFNVNFSAATSGTYDATVTINNNDPNNSSYTYAIQAEEILSATTTGTATICSGTSTTLSATSNGDANTTYQWYCSAGPISGANSSTYATPTSLSHNANYYVVATDGIASVASNTVTVTVNPTPVAAFNNPAAQCYKANGNTFNFTDASTVSSGSVTKWSWGYNNGQFSSTAQNPGFTSNSAGTYPVTLSVTSDQGCPSATVTGSVTVNPLPVTIVNNATIVVGSNVNLGSASNNTSDMYSWSGSNIFNPNSSNPTAQPVSMSTAVSTFTYTVTETTPASCSATTTVTVTVNPLTISISGNSSVCVGGSSVLTASTDGPNVQWYLNGSPISGATGSTYTATVAGNYSASTTNGNRNAFSNSINFVINPNATAVIGGGGSLCGSGTGVISMTILAGQGVSYTFHYTQNGVQQTQTGSGNGVGVGSYNNITTTQVFVPVSLTVSSGCPTSVSGGATITVNPIPAAYAGNSHGVFAGTSVTIGTTAVGSDTYSWSDGSSVISTSSEITVTPTTQTTYTLTEKTPAGCSASNSVQIGVVALPVITPETTTSLCQGGSVILDATNYGANANANYQWYFGSSSNLALATAISGATSISYTANASGYYFVNAYGGNPVISGYSTGTLVTVNPLPTATISGGTSVCAGQPVPAIGIDVENTGNASWSLVYYDGNSDQTITGTHPGGVNIIPSGTATTTYTLVSLKETSGAGCSSNPSGSTTMTINPLPAPNATATPATIVLGNPSTLSTGDPSGNTYTWTGSDGFSSTLATPSVSPASTTTYTVTETSAAGCVGTPSTVTVTVDFPNIDIQGLNAISTSNDIPDGSTTVSPNNNTDFGSTTTGTATEQYTIYNTGTSPLYVSGISFSGGNASNFKLSASSAGAYTIAANGSATFNVNFTASTAGPYSTYVVVTSNDPDEGSYNYAITANYILPAMDVQDLSNDDIANKSTSASTSNNTDFGPTTTGSETETYTIYNNGNAPLVVSSIGFSSSNFTLDAASAGSYTIAANSSANFTVDFNAAAAGTYNATVTLVNNDPNNKPYTFAIAAEYILPAINVQGNNTNIANGSGTPSASNATDFGVNTGAASETYTIFNNGTAPLTVSGITTGGTNGTNYSVGALSYPFSVPANGGTATFTVYFTASSAGAYPATVTISNSDLKNGNGSYSYAITAEDVPTPVITGTNNFCAGGSTVLTCAASETNYQWYNGSTKISGATGSSYTATAAGSYYVVSTIGSSVSSNTIAVSVNPLPTAKFTVSAPQCYNVNGNTFTFTDGSSVSGGNITDNEWTFGWANGVGSGTPTTYTYGATGTFNVTETVTSNMGCTATATGTAVVYPTPGNNAGSNQTINSGSSATIGAPAVSGDIYAWTSSPSGFTSAVANPTVNPTVTTTYTLTEKNANGCSVTNTVTITVNPTNLPKVTPNGPTTFCPGGSVTLSTSGSGCQSGTKYQWYNGTTKITGATSSSYVATAAGTYYVTVTNGNTTATSLGTTVTLKAVPTETAGANQTICGGTYATLSTTAVTGDSYTWYINDEPNGTPDYNSDDLVGTGASVKVKPSATTQYFLIATNGTCAETTSVSITVLAAPTANAGSNQNVCAGTTVTLGAASGCSKNTSNTSFTYSWTSNPAGFTSTALNPTVTAATTTTYTLTVSNGTCSATSSVTVTVKASPTETAGSDQTICAGGSATLSTTSVSGHSYTWYINSMPQEKMDWDRDDLAGTGPSVTVKPSATTNYFLIATNGTCAETTSVNVIVIAAPTANAGGNKAICSGSSTTIGSSCSTTGLTFAWTSSPVGFTSASANPVVSPTVNTTYYLTVSNSNGCKATSSMSVSVSSFTSTPTITASGPTTFCNGGSVKLSSSLTGCGYTYSWSNQNGPILGCGSNSATITVTTSGTYYVTVTNAGGCSKTSAGVTVTVNPTPKLTVCGDQSYNYGYDNCPTISASCDQKNGSFNWCNGSSCVSKSASCSVNPSQNTTYNCTVTTNGCQSAPETCNVFVRDVHCYDNNNNDYNNKCSICYYNSSKKQWSKTTINKCDANNDIKSGNYQFGDCGSGDNLADQSDDISIYPNPFNTITNIRINFVQDEQVKVDVVSMEGRIISTVFEGNVSSGMPYSFTFDGSAYMSGIYMVRIISGNSVQVRKIDLLKN